MAGTMQISLPEAPPQLYLAWMTFIVTLEQAIRGRPRLRSTASRQGLVVSDDAELTRRVLVQPLTAEAEGAIRERAGTVTPSVEGSRKDLSRTADYLLQWGEWLATTEVMAKLSMTLPPPEVAALRRAVIKTIQEQTSAPR
jgi:hypothetical protein